MSSNPLDKLVLDYWYKVITVAGFFILVTSLTINLENIDNNIVQLISLGSFLFGMGEWANHPLQESIKYGAMNQPIAKISGYPRKTSLIGLLFDIIGISLIAFGIYKIFN